MATFPSYTLVNTRTFSAARHLTATQLRQIVRRVAATHGVRRVRVFGSFARGEQRRASDLDLLVDLPKGTSLLDLVGLKQDLEAAVGRKVDLVPEGNLKPALRERILADARLL